MNFRSNKYLGVFKRGKEEKLYYGFEVTVSADAKFDVGEEDKIDVDEFADRYGLKVYKRTSRKSNRRSLITSKLLYRSDIDTEKNAAHLYVLLKLMSGNFISGNDTGDATKKKKQKPKKQNSLDIQESYGWFPDIDIEQLDKKLLIKAFSEIISKHTKNKKQKMPLLKQTQPSSSPTTVGDDYSDDNRSSPVSESDVSAMNTYVESGDETSELDTTESDEDEIIRILLELDPDELDPDEHIENFNLEYNVTELLEEDVTRKLLLESGKEYESLQQFKEGRARSRSKSSLDSNNDEQNTQKSANTGRAKKKRKKSKIEGNPEQKNNPEQKKRRRGRPRKTT